MQRLTGRLRALHALQTMLVLVLAMWALPARADLYHYTYTGNAFTMTAQLTDWPFGHPTQGRDFVLESISAEFYTAAPLTAGMTLADVTDFSMTISPWYGRPWTLTPPQYPVACPGCVSLTVTGGLSIGEVNELGLPGVWDLWTAYEAIYPTGRHETLTLSSTRSLDSLTGGYEAFIGYSGGLAASPGVWAVTQVVPEPATLMMFAVGGLLVAWFARRRSD
ncbi:PEP-CTERM protein-sorting domain-containing protein [Roseateles sp. YR242]|uniref:PEP-CTERM sorting domain-containing protein n=1 Tax=Roseateles sp. YR242 TaxID=1855305 RepID=UPI0008BA4004|nr:PEP-CTERM sorting domain-containing protein [Roseateles sp. YR242]SEL40199.1 PEP-CTERM protein-sorting domain-containing protein [Roseateles sp. YR242]